MVDTTIEPVADKAYLVGPGLLSNNCNGLFTFRVDNGEGEPIEMFVTFVDGALFLSSFMPETGNAYSYLYGIGLKQ